MGAARAEHRARPRARPTARHAVTTFQVARPWPPTAPRCVTRSRSSPGGQRPGKGDVPRTRQGRRRGRGRRRRRPRWDRGRRSHRRALSRPSLRPRGQPRGRGLSDRARPAGSTSRTSTPAWPAGGGPGRRLRPRGLPPGDEHQPRRRGLRGRTRSCRRCGSAAAARSSRPHRWPGAGWAVAMDPVYTANKHAVVGLARALGPALGAGGHPLQRDLPGVRRVGADRARPRRDRRLRLRAHAGREGGRRRS